MAQDTDQELLQLISGLAAALSIIFVGTILFGVLSSTFQVDLLNKLILDPFTVFVGLVGVFSIFVVTAFYLSIQRQQPLIFETPQEDEKEGALNLDLLSRSPEKLFRENVWRNLPDEPKQDIHESILALDNGAPIASILTAMKATEYALAEWYQIETGRKDEPANWSEIMNWLRRDPRFSPGETGVLDRINRIRELRSNATHPGHKPTEEEAEEFLMEVRGLLTSVYSRIDTYQARLSDFSD